MKKTRKVGDIVSCHGEGGDLFVIAEVRKDESGYFLCTPDGYGHGWEAAEKVYGVPDSKIRKVIKESQKKIQHLSDTVKALEKALDRKK